MRLQFSTLLIVILMVSFFYACSKKEEAPAPIDPAKDPQRLAEALQFTNDTKQTSGNLPASTGSAPYITNSPSASTISGNVIYIPVVYSSGTVSKVLVQVVGSNFYFEIPVSSLTAASGYLLIPLNIPSNILVGNFTLNVSLTTSTGSVSSKVNVPVGVTAPRACGDGHVEGSSGITYTRHAVDGKSGSIKISYDTYSLPDRIDVYLDGKWITGTGSSTTPPPPLSYCNNPGSGFVGKYGTFTVPVTADSKNIDIYVSGCLGNSTAWYYDLTCP